MPKSPRATLMYRGAYGYEFQEKKRINTQFLLGFGRPLDHRPQSWEGEHVQPQRRVVAKLGVSHAPRGTFISEKDGGPSGSGGGSCVHEVDRRQHGHADGMRPSNVRSCQRSGACGRFEREA